MQGRPRSSMLWGIYLLAAIGCQAAPPLGGSQAIISDQPLVLDGTRQDMRDAVARRVPVGTDLEEAGQIMRQEGFQCSQQQLKGNPALICTRNVARATAMRYEQRVILWDDHGKVASIDVESYGLSNLPAESRISGNPTAAGGG